MVHFENLESNEKCVKNASNDRLLQLITFKLTFLKISGISSMRETILST